MAAFDARNRMLKSESSAFEDFDDELKLDPAERLKAQNVHNRITELLKAASIIIQAFLQGSLARKTMIAPLRDIDKVVILHPFLWDELNRPGGADLVMDRIEALLSAHYPRATFERCRHALKMTIDTDSFTFDIVPAFETSTDDDDVLIANRETGCWDRSNTRTLIRVVAERNLATGGLFIHQARMAKHLVRNLLHGDLPGLHVESIAFAAITGPLEHAEAVTRILDEGAALLGGSYYEPTGVERISDKLKPDVRVRSQQCFASAAERAVEARRLAAAGDHNGAIAIWHELFGDPFPAPAAQSVNEAFSNSFGGSITSTGYVSSTRAGRQPARPTRSWRA